MDSTTDDDQDFSQSIQWDTSTSSTTTPSSHHHQPDPTSPYSAYTSPTQPPTTQPNHRVSNASVKDGKIELEATSDMFVSYLVTATLYNQTTPSSRRRFQDFVFLRDALVKDFPACVVPPLPEKHRMEYVVGDRFSQEFIERRRIE